jgi:hypothetical protein
MVSRNFHNYLPVYGSQRLTNFEHSRTGQRSLCGSCPRRVEVQDAVRPTVSLHWPSFTLFDIKPLWLCAQLFSAIFTTVSLWWRSVLSGTYKACSKKDRTFAIKTLLLILHHFKHFPIQGSHLYWRYTVPNFSSTVGMLPGTHFLWWRAVLISRFAESLVWVWNDVLLKWF